MKIVIRGIVKNTSTLLVIAETDIDSSLTQDEATETADQLQSVIKTAFRSGANGFLCLGDVVIDVQSFAIISVSVEG